MLPTQLFVTRQGVYAPEKIKPVRNYNVKPIGGLWTSTFDVETKNGWVEFCENEMFALPESGVWRGYILVPMKKARIYTIDNFAHLYHLIEKYPYRPYEKEDFSSFMKEKVFIDFEKMSKDYDAIHLTDDGQWQTRYTPGIDLYGWDFESTLWFRDCFTKIIPTSFKVSISKEELEQHYKDVEQAKKDFEEYMKKKDTELVELVQTNISDVIGHLRAQ